MLKNFVKPLGEDRLCVVDGDKIKLGGSGLALLALYEFNRAAPDPTLVETARALGRYILDQRAPDGDLVHGRKYPSGETYAFRSGYYTGEALFGLLRLHQMTGEALWRDAALEVIGTLGPRDYGVAEQSHWMLYTLDLADALAPNPANREYAARVAARGISAHRAYMARNKSTPIACRSEALLAYMRILGRSDAAGLGLPSPRAKPWCGSASPHRFASSARTAASSVIAAEVARRYKKFFVDHGYERQFLTVPVTGWG